MNKWHKVQIICKDCRGEGRRVQQGPPLTEEPCLDCQGEGYVDWGRVKLEEEEE